MVFTTVKTRWSFTYTSICSFNTRAWTRWIQEESNFGFKTKIGFIYSSFFVFSGHFIFDYADSWHTPAQSVKAFPWQLLADVSVQKSRVRFWNLHTSFPPDRERKADRESKRDLKHLQQWWQVYYKWLLRKKSHDCICQTTIVLWKICSPVL